jgi:hypothetical protein
MQGCGPGSLAGFWGWKQANFECKLAQISTYARKKVMQWLLEHSDPLRNYAIILGGVIGLYFAWLRVSASNKQADAQIRQAQLARQDHVAELFNRAASQLKDKKLEVRLAAILTLRQICDDFDDLSDP